MPEPFVVLFGQRWPTPTIYAICALIATTLILLWRVPRSERAGYIDALLGAIVGSVLLGRLSHVWLQWAYFVDRPSEITQLVGFDWHGVAIGALFGAAILARWRNVEWSHLLNRAALILPLFGIAVWWGCAGWGCAYGTPVNTLFDYPRWLTWDARDLFGLVEPRFAVQRLGIGWSLCLFVLALLLTWRGWLSGRRAWLMATLVSLGTFMLGFLRADYAVLHHGLRADQWLDLVLALYSGVLLLKPQSDYHNP